MGHVSSYEKHEVVRKMKNAYPQGMTPEQFAGYYRNLSVPMEDESRGVSTTQTAHISKYRLGLSGQAADEKSKLLQKLRDTWKDGKLREFKDWADTGGGIVYPFNGKALPEEMSLTCYLAVACGYKTVHNVVPWAEENFGLDCSGFVNGLMAAIGKKRTTIKDFARDRFRLRKVDDIKSGTLIVWRKGEEVMTDPGHIAIVDRWAKHPDKLQVVEATGRPISKLNTGDYTITSKPSKGLAFEVKRPNGAKADVFFCKQQK